MKFKALDSITFKIFCLFLASFILMFGYNTVEAAYPLKCYKEAIIVLSILYLSLTLFYPLVSYLISFIPVGRLIILSPIGYSLFSVAPLLDFYIAIILAITLGFLAAIFWIGCKAIIFHEVNENSWGVAFGLLSFVSIIASGLGPFIFLGYPSKYLKLYIHTHFDVFLISSVICSLATIPLLYLRNIKVQDRPRFKIKLTRIFIIYLVISFCYSSSYSILISYIPLLAPTLIGEYRFLSYAIPSTLSTLGGLLYDRFGPIVFPPLSLITLISFANLEKDFIIWGFFFNLSISLLFPGFQAHLGKIIKSSEIIAALGIAGFVSGFSLPLNSLLIGILPLEFTRLYLTALFFTGFILSFTFVIAR